METRYTNGTHTNYSVSDDEAASSEDSVELSLSSNDRGFLANGALLSTSSPHTSSTGMVWSTVDCFLHFILLFWNQVLTCVSLRSSEDASSMRSGTERYFFSANLDSSPSSCTSVKTVRSLRFLFWRFPRFVRWFLQSSGVSGGNWIEKVHIISCKLWRMYYSCMQHLRKYLPAMFLTYHIAALCSLLEWGV